MFRRPVKAFGFGNGIIDIHGEHAPADIGQEPAAYGFGANADSTGIGEDFGYDGCTGNGATGDNGKAGSSSGSTGS